MWMQAEMTGDAPNAMALATWTRRHGQEGADTRELITHSAPALMGSMAGKRTKPLCHRAPDPWAVAGRLAPHARHRLKYGAASSLTARGQ